MPIIFFGEKWCILIKMHYFLKFKFLFFRKSLTLQKFWSNSKEAKFSGTCFLKILKCVYIHVKLRQTEKSWKKLIFHHWCLPFLMNVLVWRNNQIMETNLFDLNFINSCNWEMQNWLLCMIYLIECDQFVTIHCTRKINLI